MFEIHSNFCRGLTGTLQHAMRKQILRLMRLDTDKNLPDGHIEDEPLDDDEPIRFVWDKTTKQSTHNYAMRTRIIASLKDKRSRKPRMYRFLKDSDFKERRLEDSFDQVYTTLRQKFRSQRDQFAASNYKRREEHKAMKVRRLSRKKAVRPGIRITHTHSRQYLEYRSSPVA